MTSTTGSGDDDFDVAAAIERALRLPLGHASIQITADTYGHDNIESAQSALDAALKRAEGE